MAYYVNQLIQNNFTVTTNSSHSPEGMHIRKSTFVGWGQRHVDHVKQMIRSKLCITVEEGLSDWNFGLIHTCTDIKKYSNSGSGRIMRIKRMC